MRGMKHGTALLSAAAPAYRIKHTVLQGPAITLMPSVACQHLYWLGDQKQESDQACRTWHINVVEVLSKPEIQFICLTL
jgi:hypothetical protein